jgi:hypothetical protein
LKTITSFLILLIILLGQKSAFTQEWNILKSYQKETGHSTLQSGCWLKKDRKKNTEIWNQANLFNLSIENGNQKYRTIYEIRDFYIWFDDKRKEQGHDINAAGVAAIVANQFAKIEVDVIRWFVVRNKEIVHFADTGSRLVFDFAFPLMNEIFFSTELFKGDDADNWSLKQGKIEQCQILEPLYNNMSAKAIERLEKMAKGKGLFFFGVPKKLRYEGSINDCNKRLEHAIKKILPYYIEQNN